MNELSQETSPYLLQHAQNPVHWKAWNESALAKAQSENKLIIVSIGYSACHWCHVMEHKTFEDDEAAQTMNTHFVPIKIDREERPDIDAVYMKAIQIMTGHGGWPLNVVCLPDGRPVWGGTYFRKNEWINILEQLAELYQTNPQKMVEYAQKLQAGIESISIIQPKNNEAALSQDLLIPLVEKWKKSFDPEFGGMARAPKFMMPNNYEFLLRYGFENKDPELLDFVDLTLTKMAYGGLFDTVGGGFSRYSVDMKWHVPHFEKMLYDNGQLVSLYANAYKRTQNPLYQEIVEKTLGFIAREWTTPEGAFYAALDADSLNAENHLEEGAFYVWTQPELERLIGADLGLFAQVFNTNDFGLWENGNYVLIQNESLENIANRNQMSLSELKAKKKKWEQILFVEREKRSKPRLDDKCLTSWNAIMCKGYVDASKAFGKSEYLETAIRNAQFICNKQWHPDGHLWHSYKNGQSTINGYLEDYAWVISAFVSLYEATFDENWLHRSKQVTDYCFEHFFDGQSGFFHFTSRLDAALIAPHYETEDNVIPASNSVMATNLYQLSVYFDNSYYESVARKMLQHIVPDIDYPSAFSNWLLLFFNESANSRQLVICGTDAKTYAAKINEQYLPNILLAGCQSPSSLPLLKNRFSENELLFYVCQNKTCALPSRDFAAINKDLKP
ncbi:thioredoxin domain-containing protein [Flavobacterium sp.]|uniref:thioredoxin domain-containing protein n=1 Tax=Flavobacterium sp. TaxID=239 RepID=UPI0039E4D168